MREGLVEVNLESESEEGEEGRENVRGRGVQVEGESSAIGRERSVRERVGGARGLELWEEGDTRDARYRDMFLAISLACVCVMLLCVLGFVLWFWG